MVTYLFICVAFLSFACGIFVYMYPEKIIEIHKRFYALINWRMEPISIPKEIRNTKWMGLFLISVTLIACAYYWLQ